VAEGWNSGTEEMAVAKQRHGKHLTAVTNKHATTEGLLDSMSSIKSNLRLYNVNAS
jgi:hypothetical protein